MNTMADLIDYALCNGIELKEDSFTIVDGFITIENIDPVTWINAQANKG